MKITIEFISPHEGYMTIEQNTGSGSTVRRMYVHLLSSTMTQEVVAIHPDREWKAFDPMGRGDFSISGKWEDRP